MVAGDRKQEKLDFLLREEIFLLTYFLIGAVLACWTSLTIFTIAVGKFHCG